MKQPTNADKNNAAGLLDEASKLVIKATELLEGRKNGELNNVALMLVLQREQLRMEVFGLWD